jgi:hypothetical protein
MARHSEKAQDALYRERTADINDCGNNTEFNQGPRDSSSPREQAGMAELARPSQLYQDMPDNPGDVSNDTHHTPANVPPEHR